MRKLSTIMVLAAMAFMMSTINANALTVGYDNTDQYTIREVDDYRAFDYEMYGMEVSITLSDNSTTIYEWRDLGTTGSGIDDGDTSIFFDGDSWTSWWQLSTNEQITNITFDAFQGNAVFDVVYDTEGTAGSKIGRKLSGIADSDDYITATYSGVVALNDDNPVGDLYRYLSIDFDAGYNFSSPVSFTADMDNVTVVPEPSTILLLGFGLLGLVGFKRRKTNK